MYIALTEEEGKKIRSMGVSVIEYKRCIRDGIKISHYIIVKASKALADAANTFLKLWDNVAEKLCDAIDDVRIMIEEIRESLNYPTSLRYKIVKFISKVGYDKRKVWVATRRTWLARSCC